MKDSVYDYENQCWVVDGIIESCAHPDTMRCSCYGKRHAGERVEDVERLEKQYIA